MKDTKEEEDHTETDLVVDMSTLTHDAWARRRS